MENLNCKTFEETQETGYLHFLNLVVNGEPRKEYLSDMMEIQNRFDDLYLWTSGCDSIEDSPDIKVWRKARIEDLIKLGIDGL